MRDPIRFLVPGLSGGGHAPAPSGALRGQYIIRGNSYPLGPRPGTVDNPFFMGELDTLWWNDKAAAQRILNDYVARGANHITVGPVLAHGYDRVYPDTDYRGKSDLFCDFLEWVQSPGITASLYVLPDIKPYYDGDAHVFDWGAIERDLTPILNNPRLQTLVKRVVYMWEDFQAIDAMAKGYDYLKRQFPKAKRYWHSPKGHLSPGLSTEEERRSYDVFAAHGMDGLYLQARPITDRPRPGERSGFDQMKYDLWDMGRRFRGESSPWGGPILKLDGSPLEIVYAEGTAYAMYHAGYPESLGKEWGAGALTVKGVTDCLDGIP